MNAEHLTTLLLDYRYWILIPLSFIEGPIAAFIAATLASAGYFNIGILAALFFIRDVGLDLVYYSIGHFGARTAFVQRMLKKIGVTEGHIDDIRALWEKHPGRTMLIGKLSYGIASAFIVVAGTVGMRLRGFVLWGSVVAVLQYGTLLFLGYYFGNTIGANVIHSIEQIQYILLGLSVVAIAYYVLSRYMRRQFFKAEKEAGKQ